jgi:uncharacterized protein
MRHPADYQPVAAQERILLIDLLRGLAMFGVLWSNLNDWYGPPDPHTTLESAFHWVQEYLIETRFYSLIGFLFGYGFGIQFLRAEERGIDVRAMFYRRMGALLAIGLAHGLLVWRGDILTAYAITGAVLALFRRASSRALLIAAAIAFIVVPAAEFTAVSVLHLPLAKAPDQDRIDWVYSNGSLIQSAAMGRESFLYWYRRWAPLVLPPFVGLFLLGLCAAKHDLLRRIAGRRQDLLRWFGGAAVATLICSVVIGRVYQAWPAPKPPITNPLRDSVMWVLGSLAPALGGATYAAGLAALATIPAIAARLAPLAAIGRMSLTTYLTQSLISITLFYHFGFGLYGRATYPEMFAITVVVFALQMAVSSWWLRRFRFGPAEWAWRSIAYMRPQPMRQPNQAGSAAAI